MNTLAPFVLLIFVTAAYSYCNPIADLCTAAGIACPTNGDNTCTFNNSTTDFDYFDVICFGHLYLPTGFIKGRAAMGHDFNKEGNSVHSDVNIGAGLTASDQVMPYSLICASDISWPYGELYPVPAARVFYSGRHYSTPKNLEGRVDTCSTSGCVNSCFSKMRNYHESLSTFIAQQSPTATTSLTSGVLTISCTSSSNHYFISIKGSTFNSVTSYSISPMCNQNAIFAFNIEAGSSVEFNGTPFSATGTVYNLAGAETATVNADVYGTILNARGNMNQNGGTIYGWVLAGECPKLQQIERPLCPGSTSISSSTSGTQSNSTSGQSNTTGTSQSTASVTQSATSGNPYTSGGTSSQQYTTEATSENPYTSGTTSEDPYTSEGTSGQYNTSGTQSTTGTTASQSTTSETQSTTSGATSTSGSQSTTSATQSTSGDQSTTSGGILSTSSTTLPTQNVESSSTGSASIQTPSILFFVLAAFCVSFFITS